MSLNLTGMRHGLAEALSAAMADVDGLTVHTSWEDRIADPALLVLPAPSWVSAGTGDSFGHASVSLDVIAVAGSGDREQSLDDLESLVSQVIGVALAQRWRVTGASEPGLVAVGGASVLASTISVTQSAKATIGA